MTFIPLPAARAHLCLEDDYPAEQVQAYIDAAGAAVQAHLDRALYASDTDLAAARSAYPAAVTAADAALAADVSAADALTDPDQRRTARTIAALNHAERLQRAHRCLSGIVISDDIRAAMLLLIGHLYANRAAVIVGTNAARLPLGVKSLLRPYRHLPAP